MTSTETDWLLPVRMISDPFTPRRADDGSTTRVDHLLVVTDPDLGEVSVRWRIPDNPYAWTWRCPPCGLRSRTAACRHTFSAAIELAGRLLGLKAVAVTPPQGATR